MKLIYLDYAAATPLDADVVAAMTPFWQQQFYNPSAQYQAARDVRKQLEQARVSVAQTLGARPSEIVFTAGGTESDNLAIHGIMRRFPDANLVVSAIEHDAVLEPANDYDRRIAPVDGHGVIDLKALQQQIDDQTVLISVMQANNEIGTIQPVREVSRLVSEIRDDRRKRGVTLPLLLHSDACQAANYCDVHVARLGIDLLTINGSKLYGPKQSGLLYVRGGLTLAPLIAGGGQERGLRSGTENVAACVGLAMALTKAQALRRDESQRLQHLQRQLIKDLQTRLPQIVINGSLKYRLPNNLHVTIHGVDNERLLIELDEAGIQAAAGSACSASSDMPSHVLKALGLSDEQARSSVRFSMGRQTTSEQIDQLVDTLQQLVA